ncbi:Ionotropic receptor 75e, partial [Diabrotica virgifera virgifera]
AMMLTEERARAINFLAKADTWKIRFLLKKPSMSYVENIYLMTFTAEVWIATVSILFMFCLAIYFLMNWEKKEVIDYVVLCSELKSKTYAGKILLFLLFAALMFLYSAYSGYILVLLQSTTPIKSIRHLVDSRLEVGGINVSYQFPHYN